MSDPRYGGGGGHRASDDDEFDHDGDTFASQPAGRGGMAGRGGAAGRPGGGSAGKTTLYSNQPYDEAVELSDAELEDSVDTHALSSSHAGGPSAPSGGGGGAMVGGARASAAGTGVGAPSFSVAGGAARAGAGDAAAAAGAARGGSGTAAFPSASASASASSSSRRGGGGDAPPDYRDHDARGEYASDHDDIEIPGGAYGGRGGGGGGGGGSAPGSPSDDGSGGGGGDDGSPGGSGGGNPNPGITGIPPKKAQYNPGDFVAAGGMRGLPDEVAALFEHITAYKPRGIELDCQLKCFVPDYLPAVGEVDAFLKPPRPDGAEERLGLGVLDEPSTQQSDPTVLDLQLRAASKRAGVEPALVRSLEHAASNPKEVTRWISNVVAARKATPPPTVHHLKPMPDVEKLMGEWPPSVEAILKTTPLPSADMALSSEEYARTVCALLDVPVHGASVIPSLHTLFSLYTEFRDNAHFAKLGAAATAAGGAAAAARAAAFADVDALVEGKDSS